MTFTATDVQQFVIATIGDTPDNRLATNAAMVWAFYADKALIYPRLQQAYFTMACCDIVLGTLRSVVNISESGTVIADSQRFDHVETMRTAALATIADLEKKARARRGVSGGRIAQAAPITLADEQARTLPDILDANTRAISGDPYYPIYPGID